MRSYNSEDEYDQKELAKLKAEPWMVELLKLNPEYVHWGPNEDYMIIKGEGWNAPKFHASWKEFGPWHLDEINECANFYFEISRNSVQCEDCDSSGLNEATHQISEDFYDFNGTGRRWADNITQDEVDALIASGRLGCEYNRELEKWVPRVPHPTVAEVNAANGRSTRPMTAGFMMPHDAIDCWILLETRAKRLGVWGHCSACEGQGHIFTEPSAHVNLVLWWLFPRKGASCGIEVQNIQKAELPEVFGFLKQAADRNAERFAQVGKMASTGRLDVRTMR